MSIRAKTLTIMLILLTLMTLSLNYTVRSSEGKHGGSSPSVWGTIISLAVIISILFFIVLFLSWRDIKLRRKDLYKESLASHIARGVAFALLAVVSIYFIEKSRPSSGPFIPNLTNNTTNGTGQIGIPQSANLSPTHNITGGAGGGNLVWIGYAAGLAFVAGVALMTVRYYRDAVKRRKREAIRKRAEAFDTKLNETGLEMFSNPKEAVVGIYKNAVLWLEYLGLPYKESWTHWEHAEHVRYKREAFVTLTKLFEKAKYAPEKVTWEDAERALSAYKELRGGFNEGQ
ncbi:hypothetical protein A3L09_01095 [Thermococcus profundus]|uniref:Protein-glutamine gamma-glutamyltransferase-like C-terminal domain-containing protein n=1 Tax=Thermococcus profundus TaxID=49899 RepID=A0A2Z2MDB0_THEPR|nr:DUF4129 domain-containing protein [Thermococcus profundus]ASJ01954.1 hypothetical protein A3L09_01095 [Thermococcus profundus]